MTIDDYISSMSSDTVVGAIIKNLECRKRIFQVGLELGLVNDPTLQTALHADKERIATLLVSILSSESDEESVLRLEGDSAQNFLDVVQETLDGGFMIAPEHNRMARRIIRKLSASSDRLPSSLFIVGIKGRDEHPTFGGGFGDIYRASYGDQRVALKRMRHFLHGSDLRRMHLEFCREALVWKDLHHPYILPFLGIDRDSFPTTLCMVSPWMKNGSVMNYLKTHGHANVDMLLYEIAQGLEYLHSHAIVHGDLKGANILVKENGSACLADFGLSIYSDASAKTSSTSRGGSPYWMAPELLDPDQFGLKFARTVATDVYAYGCVCFELYTEQPPFSGLAQPVAWMKVLKGERAARPLGPPVMSDTLWQHVTEFWAQRPITRPSTQSVVQKMIWPNPGSQSSWSASGFPLIQPASLVSFTPAFQVPISAAQSTLSALSVPSAPSPTTPPSTSHPQLSEMESMRVDGPSLDPSPAVPTVRAAAVDVPAVQMSRPVPGASPTLEQKKASFLSAPHFAVVGASTSEDKMGTKVLKWLIKGSKDVVPVNLVAQEIQGIKCMKSLSELPDPTHTSVSIVVPPKATLAVLQLAKSLGIYFVWLQPGAEDDAVVEFIEADPQFQARCIYKRIANSPKIGARLIPPAPN
ncbi:Kinase-like protein [Mycena sanguinolenta]|uniref:Kinase-like protein n=1 Tax=Mycena sanguinolenta TaxID=230812 RepID=A0A8H6ZBB9_9AGAR|nr:Kinase-like protein [Mycena sanguinolenta]